MPYFKKRKPGPIDAIQLLWQKNQLQRTIDVMMYWWYLESIDCFIAWNKIRKISIAMKLIRRITAQIHVDVLENTLQRIKGKFVYLNVHKCSQYLIWKCIVNRTYASYRRILCSTENKGGEIFMPEIMFRIFSFLDFNTNKNVWFSSVHCIMIIWVEYVKNSP